MTAREKFEVGDRVRLNEEGRRRRTPSDPGRLGTVARLTRSTGVYVLWDGRRTPAFLDCSLLEHADPGFDPPVPGNVRGAPEMSRIADLFCCVDRSRSEAEGQHYCEVVENYGEDDERVLYVTTWYRGKHSAMTDARDWMKANGVTEGD